MQNTPQSNSSRVDQPQSPRRSFYSIFHTITALFAIYLSFKCNAGFAVGDFLIACCCPVLYIIYRAATSNFCSVPVNVGIKQ
jgi:hypothetical protein